MSGHFHVFLALAHCLRTKTRGNFGCSGMAVPFGPAHGSLLRLALTQRDS